MTASAGLIHEYQHAALARAAVRALATTFGIADPSPAQRERLTACWEHYRANLPPDMKVELYGNGVRIEPGAFGAHAKLINTVGGFLAEAVPDG